MEKRSYTIPEGTRRIRADKALAAAFPEHSRSALQRAFEAGLVSRGGRVLSQKDDVVGGDVLEFSLPDVVVSELRPVELPLNVLFEDAHMIVLNKAAGMVVHPGAGTGDDTLVHALLAHCRGELSGIGGVERPGIVHRIDKETTGALVVAKTDAAHRALADQFASRTLQKDYVALITGVPPLLSGVIDRGISRHPVHRQRMTVGEGGRPARTDWSVLEAFEKAAALVRCRIHSGRTHQIRVHFKSIGHPLLGDSTYGWKQVAGAPVPPRVMLHAERIALTHPVSGKPLEIVAPWPEDFRTMIAALRTWATARVAKR